MRITQSSGDFKAKAIAGTHTVLIALDCVEGRRKGLKGFSFQREMVGAGSTGAKFLRSQKVFKSVVPDPKNAHDPADPTKPARFYTDKSLCRASCGATMRPRRRPNIASLSGRCTALPAR